MASQIGFVEGRLLAALWQDCADMMSAIGTAAGGHSGLSTTAAVLHAID